MATEFITTNEAAERLGTTRQTIALYIRQHKIPAIRFGKEYRIPRAEFERLLQAPPTPEGQEPTQEG
jgi:excisionase family DNA binding protein